MLTSPSIDESQTGHLPFAEPEASTSLFQTKAPMPSNVQPPSPQRIFVTGNAGSGKSTLAKQLGELLGLPVFGLDSIVWQPGWKKTPPKQRERLENKLLAREKWIIEGVSTRIQKKAEMVIFLDIPRKVSLWRCARRNLPYLFRSRPGLPENCPEWKILPRLATLIWDFPVAVRPRIFAAQKESPAKHGFFQLVSRQELQYFLRSLTRET